MSLSSFFSEVGSFFENMFKSVVSTEVAALQPIAVQVVENATTDIATAAATGKLSSLGTVLGTLITQTATQAEAAGIVAGIGSLGATVTAALASHPAVIAVSPATAGTAAKPVA